MNTINEALRLYALGYHVVPFTPRTSLNEASKPQVTDYIQIKPDMTVHTRQYSEFDIAIVPQECCVLDLEMKNGLNGVDDLTKLAVQNGTTWEQVTNGCFITKTKSNGFHVWYRQPSGERLVGGLHIRPGIEGKAINGTVHVPPSLGYTASVPIYSPSDLPELPGFIADAWRTAGKKRGEKLDTAISLYPLGQRRQYLLSYAGTLRERVGCSVEELASMLRTRRDSHCEDPGSFSDEEVLAIAKDIGRKPIHSVEGAALAGDAAAQSVMSMVANAKKTPAPQVTPQVTPQVEEDRIPIIVVNDIEEENALIDPLYAPSWCEPTPMFKMFQDWCRKGALRFQPEMNLLVAATTFGSIMGRTYTGATGVRSNLYAIALIPTGGGKEYPKICGTHLLEKLDREVCIGRGFGSDSGMIKELVASPEMMWYADEFGVAMQAWANPGTGPYFQNIRGLLLDCWMGNTYRGKALKNMDEAPSVKNPHPCLMAFCQPAIFRKYCSPDLITSGFLNRFLFTSSDKYVYETSDGSDPLSCMPEGLVPLIKSRQTEVTTLMKVQNLSSNVVFHFKKEDKEAISLLRLENQHSSNKHYSNNEVSYALTMRSSELALRLALIHAWTLGGTELTLEGFKWGMEVVNHSHQCVFDQMITTGATGDHEQKVARVLELLKKKPDGLTRVDITRSTHIEEQKLDKVITTLLNGNRIRKELTVKKTPRYILCEEQP